ncbi:hypothetical protein TcYC6_0050500 [Trypanosoma cruzi]|nr:hypothetical protein TcYC6_0050500 [Trypanosoma cruzi]
MRTPGSLWSARRLFWTSSSSTLVEWAHVANLHEESKQRPLQLATILSFAWGTRWDTLRAVYIALPQAEATHGVRAWCWDASPTPHCTPDPAQYQASKIVTRTPRGSKVEDAVFEAKLQPLPDARRVVMLCVLLPPSSATRSTPPENRTASSWPRALRFGRKLAARASRDGAAADGPDQAGLHAYNRFRLKGPSPHPEENAANDGQMASRNSASKLEQRRCSTQMERRSTLPGPAQNGYHAATEPNASPHTLV